MSSKNSFKRLLGVGAFACCSAILLSVTAQSARSEQIPSVSELGGMIGGTFRFVQELNAENAQAGTQQTSASAPSDAETLSTAADDTVRTLPDFSDPVPAGADNADPIRTLSAVSAVIDEQPVSLSAAPAVSAGDKADDWMEEEPADWMESGDKDSSSGNKDGKEAEKSDKETENDPAEKKDDAPSDKKAEEKTGADEKDASAAGEDKKTEQPDSGSDWMEAEAAEEDSGVEELTTVAAPTLSFAVNNVRHTEYLHGYEDGTARPGGKITRAEACQILYNLLGTKPAERASLSDVKDDAWYAVPMRLLAAFGIVDCPNDKARPDDYMTRAELVSALSRLVPANSVGKVSFTDVSESHPYFSAIAKAVGLGWVNGYEDGTFKPDGSITRAEAAKVVNRALSRTPDAAWIDKNVTEALYSDLSPEHWAYYELMEASVVHNVSIKNGVESWKPADPAPSEDDKADNAAPDEKEPDADAKPEDASESGSEDGNAEKASDTALDHAPSWAEDDEELARMLAEPLPEETDASRLEFEGSELYALDEKGERMTDATLGRYLTFGKDGRYTSGNEELDTYVKDVLDEITEPDMSRGEKLEAAFAYVRDNFMYRRRNLYEPGESGWDVEEALTMFKTGKGNCYNFAAAFAVLARQLGYDAEAISGLVGSELQDHGWVEIVEDGVRLYYDTVLESTYLERGYQPLDFFGKQYETAPWPYHKQ